MRRRAVYAALGLYCAATWAAVITGITYLIRR